MKIAIAQMNPSSAYVKGNEEEILHSMDKAARSGADLLVTPEMSLSGYCIGDVLEEKDFLEANRQSLQRLAKHSGSTAVVVGFPEVDKENKNEDGRDRKYNSAAVLQNGEIKGIARKSLLANYRYFDDKRQFFPAQERKPVDIDYRSGKLSLGVSICEDMWDDAYAVKPVQELSDKGADIIININASPFGPGKQKIRQKIIKEHIGKTGKPFVYVNTAGAGDNGKNIIPFDGGSMIYDQSGHLVYSGSRFKEELALFDLANAQEVPLITFSREQETYDALVMALRDYAKKSGFKRAIVPVSGGIDSALGLAITAAAFGRGNVDAFNLPSRYNSSATKSIAEQVCRNFGVSYGIIPIQGIDDLVRKTFEENSHKIAGKVAGENLHARIRGMLMMLESNDSGSLLISCGNETEIALGYSTLYGDMCGGVSVIGALSKPEVRREARHVNFRYKRGMIPEETFVIRPSAELSEGQYDPFDYSVVGPVVSEFVRARRSPGELSYLFETRQLDPERFAPDDLTGETVYQKHSNESFRDLVYATYGKYMSSVYKRLQGPPIIDVTERTLGFDLRETILNGWRGI